MPASAAILLRHYESICVQLGTCKTSFHINEIPQSINHQYKHTRFNTRLTDRAKTFRERVWLEMGWRKSLWKPKGVTAAVLLFESALWVTKKRSIRQRDADNLVKPIFDAIEKATGAEDERHWQFHVFKVASHRERTSVFLFDLGDVVEYHRQQG